MSNTIKNKCPHCADGWKPEFLDSDGVKCAISGESGELSHAYDDCWWSCPNACSCSANVHKIYCCGISECEFVFETCIHCGKEQSLESAIADYTTPPQVQNTAVSL